MTCNPASLYKLPGGSIQAGAPADFVIFDPDENGPLQTLPPKPPTAHSKAQKLYGKIHYTICNGKIVYRG